MANKYKFIGPKSPPLRYHCFTVQCFDFKTIEEILKTPFWYYVTPKKPEWLWHFRLVSATAKT